MTKRTSPRKWISSLNPVKNKKAISVICLYFVCNLTHYRQITDKLQTTYRQLTDNLQTKSSNRTDKIQASVRQNPVILQTKMLHPEGSGQCFTIHPLPFQSADFKEFCKIVARVIGRLSNIPPFLNLLIGAS